MATAHHPDASTTTSTDAKGQLRYGYVVYQGRDLAQGNNVQALDKAITDNQADISSLQTAIDANTALKAKLDTESIQASSIVAANVEADGSVTVYVK